jgi:hypothetical protein
MIMMEILQPHASGCRAFSRRIPAIMSAVDRGFRAERTTAPVVDRRRLEG